MELRCDTPAPAALDFECTSSPKPSNRIGLMKYLAYLQKVYACMCIISYICTHTCHVNVNLCAKNNVYIHIDMYIHIYMCIYLFIYTVYIYMCIHIHIYISHHAAAR